MLSRASGALCVELEVLFYTDARGRTPVLHFLEDIRTTQPALHHLIVAGLSKLRDRNYHGPPLTEQVDADSGIFELRVGRADIARVFFFFQPGQRIIVTNGYVKKRQRLDQRELERARAARRDWEERGL
jgi:phage-related protein